MLVESGLGGHGIFGILQPQPLFLQSRAHFQNIYSPGTNINPPVENFLVTVLPKLCQQVELKTSEISKNIRIFL